MTVKRLIHYLKPLWFRLLVALVCMAGVALISTGVMWLMKYLVDHALTDKDLEALRVGVVLIIAMFGLKSILWYSHTYLTSYISQSIARRLRDDAYKHLYTLSMGFFNQKTSGGILARLTNDVTILQFALAAAPTVIIRDGLTVIGLIGFLFYLNWKFALLSFSIVPLAALILTRLGIKSRKAAREGQSKMGEMYNTIQEALTAMPIVKTFQNEAREIRDFGEQNRHYFDALMKLVRVEARSSPIMEFLGAWILALLLIIGGGDVIRGAWSLGSFMAFVGAAMSLYNPIKKFASVNVQIQQGLAAAERVFGLLDEKGTIFDKPGAKPAAPLARSIEFKNVTFSYSSSESDVILKGVNLTLKKGEIVALVGASGSGKTTLAQLLLRFYDPTTGSILVDGHNLQDLTIYSLRQQTAVVTQETHLFNDTVMANIAYGKPNAGQPEIEEAARAAYAHDFIAALPQGYSTVIGERGARISGGERQRIAIARALLKNPSLLILDEATSALDAASEQAVQKALDRLLEGRTVLMIAHRLSTVRRAHRIVVLDKGKIQEMGSHEELIQQKGAYHKMYELQMMA